MLTQHDLATVRAALLFWEEEMCPHGEDAAQHYFDEPGTVPLASSEVRQLRAAFVTSRVRYALYDRERGQLADTQPLAANDAALHRANPRHRVAMILLPSPEAEDPSHAG